MILADVSQLPERHKRELLRGERVQAELAILEQQRLKEASDLLETRHIEGLGQKVLCITRELAARLRVKYGMGCLHDPAFRKRLLERNPFLRVKSIPQKMTIPVDGFRRETPAYEARGEPAIALRGRRPTSAHGTIVGVSQSEPRCSHGALSPCEPDAPRQSEAATALLGGYSAEGAISCAR